MYQLIPDIDTDYRPLFRSVKSILVTVHDIVVIASVVFIGGVIRYSVKFVENIKG